MGQFVPFQPAADDFPNHLATARPERLRPASARWLLVLLVLACVVPRAAMALRIPSVCPDGVLYVRLAEAIEAGNWRSGLRDMSLNTYPIILTGLHRLGLDWQLAASVWGVVVSSLVVLPLWGWIRRQFDDRLALVACLLYAVHPKFIEWSPEAMRDPTFWLFLMLALYWLWRAVSEVGYGYFLAGGAALMLASLTRIEGLFLLVPLVMWTFWRYRALETGRRRLLVGFALSVAAFPLLLLAVNVVFLCDHSGWATFRVSPLARIQPWLASLAGHGSAAVGTDVPAEPLSFGRMLWVFFPTMTRGLSPIYALLMFGGLFGWRRVWARRDHQPLFYVAVLVMCGIWIQLWYDRNICPRYALPIVLMASPFAALGLLWLMDRTLWAARRVGCGLGGQRAAIATVLALVAGVSLADAMTGSGKYFDTRQMAADMGCWVRTQCPARTAIVGPVGITPIVSFYASSPYQMFRFEAGDTSIVAMVEKSRASVVLLQPARQLTSDRCAALKARLADAGFEPVDRSCLPASCNSLSVLVRTKPQQRMAREPSQAY